MVSMADKENKPEKPEKLDRKPTDAKDAKPEGKDSKSDKSEDRPAKHDKYASKKTKAPVEEGPRNLEGHPAQVLEVISRTGTTGDIPQVRGRVLDGYDKGKIMRRNVTGPVKVDDILMLIETEIEASKLRQV